MVEALGEAAALAEATAAPSKVAAGAQVKLEVRNLSINAFAAELRSGRAQCIESSSVFDRAIYTIMSKMQH